MLVTICIASYKRPSGLERLLLGLKELTFKKSDAPNIEVIVVDNDITGSAHEVCANIEADFPWSLKYCVEERRGISYARNRAVASRSENTNFLAFIDDDEVPDKFWLDELLFVQQTYNADIVTGPVIPHFMKSDIPQWVTKGKFFEPRCYPTGHELEVAATNNVLICSHALEQINKFDERFALTGGEDSHFFMRLKLAGNKFIWAQEALVHEWIPPTRTTVQWVLQRGYFGWSIHSCCERELYPSISVISIRVLKGLALIAKGFCMIFPSVVLGQHALITALLNVYRGIGTIAGLIGVRYQAYKTTHGV
ncbi:MAG: glycosyltransferase [Calothrix sp. FI2-JRJ7]|jgi:glycosyltransferase involved in cell wall biosynthesis|nr:glycosyltransferase [Calothrix sp. FI2-JRJ7]